MNTHKKPNKIDAGNGLSVPRLTRSQETPWIFLAAAFVIVLALAVAVLS